jgi:hypothetical protein
VLLSTYLHITQGIDHFQAARQNAITTALGQLRELHQQEVKQHDNHNTAVLAEMWELENTTRGVDRDLQGAQVRDTSKLALVTWCRC